MDFANTRGAVLVTLLMLSFGHGCFADPLYPWIGATLRDPLIANPQARAERLERQALTWLDRYDEQPTTQGPDARSEGFCRSGCITGSP